MSTQFFTGKGDGGESVFGSCRVKKSHPLFVCLGDLDELNSWIGFCRVVAKKTKNISTVPVDLHNVLLTIQEQLFIAQAEIARSVSSGALPKMAKLANGGGRASLAGAGGEEPHVSADHLLFLENVIKRVDGILPPLNQFVISGGSEVSAALDVARAVSRRAERSFLTHRALNDSTLLPAFLNRLSSILFALARYANYELHIDEDHPSYC